MKAQAQLEEQVKRWVASGLIDEAAGQRILAHESHQKRKSSLQWPVFLALKKGPPRPIRLGLKKDGKLTPMDLK